MTCATSKDCDVIVLMLYYYLFRMLDDVDIKYLARIQNGARRHYLKFVVLIVFSPF